MSAEKAWLSMRLEGPLQSWGLDSEYSRRGTSLMPTKSALAGICCAALGLHRGTKAERSFLEAFSGSHLLAIRLPGGRSGRALDVRRLQDYHTVQNTRTAEGKVKDCHITRRDFLMDASFGAVLEGGKDFLSGVAEALEDPIWGVWLGRKACIPSCPLFAGLFDSKDAAVSCLTGGRPLEEFTRQEELDSFSEGRDSLPDNPVSFGFGPDTREFKPRRVKMTPGRLT